MNVLKKNIIANFGGSIWTGLMGLASVPFFIHFMGIESYGLVGVFATLQALLGVLGTGVSNTLNREIACLAVREDHAREMRDLVRTLEIPYWALAVVIGIGVVALSPFIAYHWIEAEHLSPDNVRRAVMIMGVVIAFQWPLGFYSGGLMGLQRQVLLNGINVVMATLRGPGAVLILWLVSSEVEAFFLFQLAISVIHVVVSLLYLWRSLPLHAEAPRFRREQLFDTWRFATGLTSTTMMSILITQADKVILSRMLSLEMFGYYTLASLVSVNLHRFTTPIFTAVYPGLTNLVALGATEELANLYHKSTQLLSAIVLPTALVIASFSHELLLLWTQSPVTAEHTHLLVRVLIIGMSINSIMHMPYALQLAYGKLRLAILGSLVIVVLIVPLMIVFTEWIGAIGAAIVWLLLNIGQLTIAVPIMHRWFLTSEKWRWYLDDIGRPLLATLAVVAVGRILIQSDWHPLLLLASLAVLGCVTVLASAIAASRLDAVARLASFWAALRARNAGPEGN